MMKTILGVLSLAGVLLLSIPAVAADPTRPEFLELYAGGMDRRLAEPEVREDPLKDGKVNIRNVSVPTLEIFRPAAGTANGTAVIVAPGGGFFTLVYDNEGTDVAKRLAQQGVTAFVLKYRLKETPAKISGPTEHAKEMRMIMARAMTGLPVEVPRFLGESLAEKDAARAVQLVREKASDLGIDPKRIGFIGFSAGAFLAVDLAIGAKETRPDFVGLIYGALRTPVPNDAPPAFIAAAANDEMVPNDPLQLYAAWKAAGRPVELHIFESGGHGFGMKQKGATSDHWFDELVWWMRSRALLPAK
jgi:acetyl esterase/lipase